MWAKIREVDHFYDRLHMMRGAKGMFYNLWKKFGDKCEILTGIPKPKRGIESAGDDKKSWMHRILWSTTDWTLRWEIRTMWRSPMRDTASAAERSMSIPTIPMRTWEALAVRSADTGEWTQKWQ